MTHSSYSTVCWNAIVRNESSVIRRCMASLVGQIDYWVVVDTGSIDDTPGIIASFFAEHGILGELHHRVWRNFADNRNEALRLAEGKADYLLLTDADMTLSVKNPDWKRGLDADAYLVKQCMPNLDQFLPRLINARLTGDKRWRYRCVTHEYLDAEMPGANRSAFLNGVELIDLDDGGCKSDKFVRDAALLAKQLAELEALLQAHADRDDEQAASLRRDLPVLLPRTLFYLAQSHENGNIDLGQAIAYYLKRIELGGWTDEVAYSWYRVGLCRERLNRPWPEAQEAYLQSWQAASQRVEAILQIVRHYNHAKQYHLSRLFGMAAVLITTPPSSSLFVDVAAHRWLMRDEYALACYWNGFPEEAERLWRTLLADEVLPEAERERVKTNLAFATKAVAEKPSL